MPRNRLLKAAAFSSAILASPIIAHGAIPDSANFYYFINRLADSLRANGGLRNLHVDPENHLIVVEGNQFSISVPKESSIAAFPGFEEQQAARIREIARSILRIIDSNAVAHVNVIRHESGREMDGNIAHWKINSDIRILLRDKGQKPILKGPERLEPYILKGKRISPARQYRIEFDRQKKLPRDGK